MDSHTDVTAEMQSQKFTPPREYKLCLVGDISAGKTSLLMRFSKNQFEKKHSATVGAMFLDVQKIYTSVSGSIPMRFNIWDTAGEERFRGLVPMYLRGSDAVIVVYDATKHSSIDELEYWVKEVRTRSSKNVAIVIAANKNDLPNKVNAKEAKAYAESVGVAFFHTSAKTGENVAELFTAVADMVSILPKPRVDADVVDLQRGTNGANPTLHVESGDWSTWLSQNLAWCSII
eukprot:m.237560 g.237560  ORF g.237560 m.237560 type:complete len:232 (+) comp19373_c0_seq2:355-1050(+)